MIRARGPLVYRMGTPMQLPEKVTEADPLEELDLDLSAFPTIQGLLESEQGQAFRVELMEFAMAARWRRARRIRRYLIARVEGVQSGVPHTAVVRDISASGARAWVEARPTLSIVEAVRFEVKVPGTRRYVEVDAETVRVVDRDARGVDIAFRFSDPAAAKVSLAPLLEQLEG